MSLLNILTSNKYFLTILNPLKCSWFCPRKNVFFFNGIKMYVKPLVFKTQTLKLNLTLFQGFKNYFWFTYFLRRMESFNFKFRNKIVIKYTFQWKDFLTKLFCSWFFDCGMFSKYFNVQQISEISKCLGHCSRDWT